MARGFMYLTAIIVVYSRFVVGWGLFNSLDAENRFSVFKRTVSKYGNPEIINSDQGCQFTSELWISCIEKKVKGTSIPSCSEALLQKSTSTSKRQSFRTTLHIVTKRFV